MAPWQLYFLLIANHILDEVHNIEEYFQAHKKPTFSEVGGKVICEQLAPFLGIAMQLQTLAGQTQQQIQLPNIDTGEGE